MVRCKKWTMVKRFDGLPKAGDLKLEEVELPPIKEGEFLSQAVYLSVDPYMRAYAAMLPLGNTMMGQQVAKIIESKNEKFPVGKYVVGDYGWRSHTISNGSNTGDFLKLPEFILPDFGSLPHSLALGVLGMPGNTSYFGFLEVCEPKERETVVVSGAAGAVGSHVGQIAKIKGCKVIGIAGSDEKGKWLTNELKFDHFINYKKPNLEKTLKELAPNGIDCYFDNVGGEITKTVLNQMNRFGRVSVCGAISGYNEKELPTDIVMPISLFQKQKLKMQGIVVVKWSDRWMEGILQNKKWIDEGKLKYKETVTEGFENMLNAFTNMLQGGNTGKAVIKV